MMLRMQMKLVENKMIVSVLVREVTDWQAIGQHDFMNSVAMVEKFKR